MSLLSFVRRMIAGTLSLGILGLAAFAFGAAPATAAEYVLTGAKPNHFYVIDMKARKIVRDHTIAGPGVGPGTILPSPDGKIAYIVTNHTKSVVGIDVDSGLELFRAQMSHAVDERTVNLGLAISPDGKKLYSYEIPARLHDDRYEVLPTRISIYPTDGGLDAKAETVFKDVPRRIHLLLTSDDGKKLYALGWDFYTMDAQTGKVVATYPLRNWTRPNASPPDLLNFWPMPEASGIFSSLMTYMRTDLPPDDPKAMVMALLTLDLKSGQFGVKPFAIEPDVYFTATIAPNRREAFTGFLKLAKIDLAKGKAVKYAELDHSYYQVNLSKDGKEVYLGGTMCDIAAYSTATLEKLGTVELPGCPDMAAAALRMVDIDLK